MGKVWKHFEKDLVEVDGIMKVVCKYCGLKMINRRNLDTNSLRNHIADSCPKISSDDKKRFIDTMKKQSSPDSFIFDPQRSRELMVKWCINAEILFNKFDDPFFALWMESMQPTFPGFGRLTVRNAFVSTHS